MAKFITITLVFLSVSGLIIRGSIENPDIKYEIISYSVTYLVQSISIIYVRLYAKEYKFNKKPFIDMICILLPLCIFGMGLGIMLHNHLESILAISIIEPGVLWAEWVTDLLNYIG